VEVRDFLAPWSDIAYRHIPAGSPYGPLDFRFAARATENRWNGAGDPTLYLARDAAVAIAEFARHIDLDRPRGLAAAVGSRQLYRIEVRVDALLDLRDDQLLTLMGIADPAGYLLDKRKARALATFVRANTDAQAILVPSVAFLDDLTRWNCVLFLEKCPADPGAWFPRVTPGDTFHLGSGP
jgi:RES domain-containing protein